MTLTDSQLDELQNKLENIMFKLCGQYFGKYPERFTACGKESVKNFANTPRKGARA